MASQLPGARAAIADKQGLPTPEFYRFLLGLQRLSAGSATSSDITALQTQITAIQSEIDGLPKSSFPTLQVAAPVYSQGLLQNGFAKIGVNVANSVIVNGAALQLDGDTAAPGNIHLYSTGPSGAKGWNALVAGANIGVIGDVDTHEITVGLVDQISQATSNAFFSPPGKIQRFNDRIFVGGATAASGDYPQTNNDWFSDFEKSLGVGATAPSMLFASTNAATASASAITGAAQSLNFTAAGTSCIGIEAFAINNNATLATNAWGIYAEAHRTTSAVGSAIGMELDVRTLTAAQAPTPYGQGTVTGLQIGAGCGVSATGQFNPSTAIEIIDNPMQWQAGIVFNDTALTTDNIAIAFASGHKMQWYSDAGTVTAAITGAGSSATNAPFIQFNDSAINVRSIGTAVLQHVFAINDSATSHLLFEPGTATEDPAISSAGGATDINLLLSPKGAGSAIIPSTSKIQWNNGSSALTFLQCAATGSGEVPDVVFADNQIQFKSSGTLRFQMLFSSGHVNYLRSFTGPSGGAPQLQAAGSDTNIDLFLAPAGSGVLRFGTFTSGATTANGYITIKDSAGFTRKLLCA